MSAAPPRSVPARPGAAPLDGYRHVDVDGLRYAYVDTAAAGGPAVPAPRGPGAPPVVCVHGNPTWSYYYRALARELAAGGRRVLVPDHIGMGRSSKPPARGATAYPYTLARRTADFGRWLDAVHPDGLVDLVVHDWGGAIALGWAVDHPERVARLVLLNTAAFRLPAGKRLPLALRLARRPVLGDLAVRHANAFARGATRLAMARSRMPREVRRQYLAPYDSPAARIGVLRFVQDIPLRPGDPAYGPLLRTEQRLPALRDTPVLICWGLRDFIFDAGILAVWERTFPHARVHRVDAGHYVLEDAADEVVPRIVEFLTPLPPGAGSTPSPPTARTCP